MLAAAGASADFDMSEEGLVIKRSDSFMKAKPGFTLNHEKKKEWLVAFLHPAYEVAESSDC
jgi:hypothetical protein